MALHTELTLDIAAYSSSVKDNCSFSHKFESKVLDVFVLESSGRVSLAASASDQEFNMQGVTDGQLVILKSDSEFTVKFNGVGNPAFTIKPQTNTSTAVETPAFLSMLASGITSIHLGNPSGSEAIEVDVAVAGT